MRCGPDEQEGIQRLVFSWPCQQQAEAAIANLQNMWRCEMH
jgi:hypothetical protein